MLVENIREALSNLMANKMRSLLTMLGIIIGITSVITITSIGTSLRDSLNATLNSMGANSLEVYLDAVIPEGEEDTFVYPTAKASDLMTDEMLEELCDTYPDEVTGYAATDDLGSGQIYASEERYSNVSVTGCTDAQLSLLKLKLLRGRNISKQDNKEMKPVCVISDYTAAAYFPDTDPIGQQIVFSSSEGEDYNFTVIGVYQYDQSKFGKVDTSVPLKKRSTTMYIPISTCHKLQNKTEGTGYEYVTILLNKTADATQASSDVMAYLQTAYADNETWQPAMYNSSSEMSTINNVINAITVAIAAIAAISLIVGGVGVMNIMTVSVTERTKEIGIRKALGAKNRTIRQQFLIESVVLCVIGSLIGIVLGIILGVVIGKLGTFLINTYYPDMADLLQMNVTPSLLAILLSVGFSMLIGVVFGSYPAKKASEMEVIDALSYE